MNWSKVLSWGVAAIFAVFFLTCSGQVWMFQVPWMLVAGWSAFIGRVLPEVTFRWDAIAETVLVAGMLGVGTHLFLRRLWRQLRPETAEASPWQVRWSVSLVALLVLLFSATMATVGIGHQVGWLASGRVPMVESSWRRMGFMLSRDNTAVCGEALRLSKQGVPDAEVAGRLLRSSEDREEAEQMHVVPRRGPGDEPGFLVFPRDPLARASSGGVRCGGGLAREESFRTAELPKLLSDTQMAAGTAP
ncbi:hypothetical protein [Archangium sp.]|uniref:hypothetical protein n=1 Tax=Archangium sp. TaxID=1872627 RepID=UPI00286B7FD1|nr:hypothetical protein [Archangium sp.]